MTTLRNKIIEKGFTNRVLTGTDLRILLNNTAASRYGMVNKALKQGELLKIRRNLYVLSEPYRHYKFSQFFLASRVLPYSYISMESAFSYYGWIPERVTAVTSVHCGSRTKRFITPFGEFVFCPIVVNPYQFLTGVRRVEVRKEEPYLLASPLRALADYVFVKKIEWKGLRYLTDSLRIEQEELVQIDSLEFFEMKQVYRSKRVLQFLEHLEKELKK